MYCLLPRRKRPSHTPFLSLLTGDVAARRTLLKGALPTELGLLSNIEYFLVGNMELEGPLDGVFSQWPKVKDIRLNDNKLTGSIPPTMDQDNPLLEFLDLEDNRLTGEVPPTLGNLVNLEALNLGSNMLEGFLPSSLANLGSLGTWGLRLVIFSARFRLTLFNFSSQKLSIYTTILLMVRFP